MISLRMLTSLGVGCLVILLGIRSWAQESSSDLIGQLVVYTIVEEDTLVDLAREYDLGYVELIAANPGVDPWLPLPGTRITLPTAHLIPDAARRGIVINLAEQRLYFFSPGRPVQTFPIGVPADGGDLRLGTTQIVTKRENPTWFPPPSVRAEAPDLPDAVPPGPDNPLGDFALYTGWTSIVIHGTNRPYGIGRRVSHGCFRLYPEDIEALYRQAGVGTPVTVIDQPAKLAWIGDSLYLEVHPSLAQAVEIEDQRHFTPAEISGLHRMILDASTPFPERIDWMAVDRAVNERRGIPIAVLATDDDAP